MVHLQRPICWLLLVALSIAACPLKLAAETVYIYNYRYFWKGGEGSGNGVTTDWTNNWSLGNIKITGDGVNPPVFERLEPDDGPNELNFHSWQELDHPVNVSVGGHAYANSTVSIQIGGTFAGGTFDVAGIGIRTATNVMTNEVWPLAFSGMTLKSANGIGIGNTQSKFDFTATSLDAKAIVMSSAYSPAYPVVGGDKPSINIMGSLVKAQAAGTGELLLTGFGGPASGTLPAYYADWVLNLADGSVILADKITIGNDGPQIDPEVKIELKGSSDSFIISPNISVAKSQLSVVRLSVHGPAPSIAPSSIFNLGDFGEGHLTIDSGATFNTQTTHLAVHEHSIGQIHLDHGNWTTKDVFVGEQGAATVMADQHSMLTSENVVIGKTLSSHTAEVTLDHESTWTISKHLYVGDAGSGHISIKNDSAIDVTQELVVGKENLSTGVIDVTSSNPLKSRALFEIGRNGMGTLNIKEGGKVEPQLDITLGSKQKGVGEATIDGDGSELHAKGKVFIGSGEASGAGGEGANGMGTITVKNGGLLKADKDVVLGVNGKSHGILNLIGSTSKLEFGEEAKLTIGKEGKGEFNLKQGATFTSASDVQLGELDGSAGSVSIDGENSHWTVQGKLTIGKEQFGRIEVRDKGKLTVTGDQIIAGEKEGSDGTLAVSGDQSTLDFDGSLLLGDQKLGKLEVTGGAHVEVKSILFGKSSGGMGELTVSGHGLEPSLFETTETGETVTGDPAFVVGEVGGGTVTINDSGQVKSAGAVLLAKSAGSTATVNITGPVSQWEFPDMTIGRNGQATVTLDKGRMLSHGNVVIGEMGSQESAVTVKGIGGELKFQDRLMVGNEGKGKLILESGGQVNSTSPFAEISVAAKEDSHGTVEVSGQGSKLDVAVFTAGLRGEATVNLKNKATIHSNNVFLGAESGAPAAAKADVTVSDATWTVHSLAMQTAGSLTVNNHGKVNVTAGASNLNIDGESASRKGMITVDGEGSELTVNEAIFVGGSLGHAELSIKGGGHVVSHFSRVGGMTPGVQSIVAISGNNSHLEQRNVLSIGGGDGDGAVLINTGGKVSSDVIVLGLASTSGFGVLSVDGGNSKAEADTFRISNGKLTATGGATVEVVNEATATSTNGTAEIEINANSTLRVFGPLNIGDEGGSGTLRANHGIVEAESLEVASLGNGSGIVIVDGPGAKLSASEVTMGVGAMYVTSGAQVWANTATIQAPSVLTVAGSVTLGSQALLAPEGTVQVNAGGIIKGNGTIFGKLVVGKGGIDQFRPQGGKVIIGNSPGVLNVQGDVTIEEGGIIEMEVGGAAPGTQHDQLAATGSITANGILDLAIVNSGGGFQLPGIGSQFTLLSAPGGISGAFENGAALRSIAGGSLVEWSLTSNPTSAVLQATAITPLVDGDYNGNGAVDAADYVVWRHTVGGINLAADGNRDGVIDNLDYGVWRTHFGGAAGAGAFEEGGAVPEPSVATLLVFGTCWVAVSNFRRRLIVKSRSAEYCNAA